MIVKSAEFIKSAPNVDQCPPGDLPEIAFVGRSNVGKSSLINVLVNRRRLARTSNTPGRTQLLNLFVINDRFMFADLPGYGYARVPASVKKTWQPMVQNYLTRRDNLRGVVLILDIRRTPGPEELRLMDWFRQLQRPCIAVLTNADKVSRSKRAGRHRQVAADLGIAPADLLLFSARTRQGKDELWRRIGELLRANPADDSREKSHA
jgi:GTP-binding protein